jgi:glycerate kinase
MPLAVVIAPNALKGSLSAFDAARAMQRGVLSTCPDAITQLVPVADGGDGTAEILGRALGCTSHTIQVEDALSRPIVAQYFVTQQGDTAVLDVATASGLTHIPRALRDPLRASSFGTGQLMRAAIQRGARKLILGVGGSATVDGGAGLLQALGVRFIGKRANILARGARELLNVSRIDLSELMPELVNVKIVVACDVENPLLGERGAARVFGPQKGASPSMVRELNQGLSTLASVVERHFGQALASSARTGAAGGIAFGLQAVLNAKLESGIDLVLDTLDFDRTLAGADLVLTAEGRVDAQSLENKAPVGVARRAQREKVPVVCLTGSIAEDFSTSTSPFSEVVRIGPATMSVEESEQRVAELLEQATNTVVQAFNRR